MVKIPKVTRGKLLKALRSFEQRRERFPNIILLQEASTFEIDDPSHPDSDVSEVKVTVRIEYPNYQYLVGEIYGSSELRDGPFGFKAPVGIIRDEVLRMANDGLVTLEMQSPIFTRIDKRNGEEVRYDPGKFFSREEIKDYKTKIVLTTKGRSVLEYWKSSFPENAVAWLSLFVSLLALLTSIFIK